jgi:hypothetical protein
LLALTRTGWRRQLGQTRSYDVAVAAGEPWQSPVIALAAALKEFQPRHVRVVLSHHFVQYRVLPWREDIAGEAEYLALAQLEFSTAFGAMAQDWTLALSDEAPGRARLAAAVPAGLLAALTKVVDAVGAKLLAVQPYLAAAVNQGLAQTRASGWRWLALHEPGRVAFAVRQAGVWRWVRHVRVGDDWAQNLVELLASEALLAGLDVAPAAVQVFAPSAGRDAWATLRAAGFDVLEPTSAVGFVAERDGAFAPAWLG